MNDPLRQNPMIAIRAVKNGWIIDPEFQLDPHYRQLSKMSVATSIEQTLKIVGELMLDEKLTQKSRE